MHILFLSLAYFLFSFVVSSILVLHPGSRIIWGATLVSNLVSKPGGRGSIPFHYFQNIVPLKLLLFRTLGQSSKA